MTTINMDSKVKLKGFFRRKEKRSPMFKSPSHYWNASTTGFLHSKGSAHVELSVDPFNKRLIRIYCQSVDKMVNYKSIEYSSRTSVQNIIERMIRVLRLSVGREELLLCETVGRCMSVDSGGGTKNKIAKHGEPFIFLEQNRRILMMDDYILTILNYWKPMYGLSRRFDLCFASKASRMVACDDSSYPFLTEPPDSAISNDSNPSFSIRSIDQIDQYTQTDNASSPPLVAPRRKSTYRSMVLSPQLILLKGDNKELPPVFPINETIEFGTTGSACRYILARLRQYPNHRIFSTSKINMTELNSKMTNKNDDKYCVFIEPLDEVRELPVLLNGRQITEKAVIKPGDIVEISNEYAFYFKDLNQTDDNTTKFNHYLNKSTVGAVYNDLTSASEVSDLANSTASSTSTTNDISTSMVNGKNRHERIDLSGITLECFDMVFNQVLIHYFEDTMSLDYTVSFVIFLFRFCRESSRCGFTLEQMQDRISKRLTRILEDAYDRDYYMVGNLKAISLLFELWLLYHYENRSSESTENDDWQRFLETKTTELFDMVSDNVCKMSADLSLCICEELPLTVSYEEHQKLKHNSDTKTMDKFLKYLKYVYTCIDAIDNARNTSGVGGSSSVSDTGFCKTAKAIKRVMTARIIIAVTESVVTNFLADMQSYNWSKGIQMLTQIEKLESFLHQNKCEDIYESDGVLNDIAKLLSLRVKLLRQRTWSDIHREHAYIPPCILQQFLYGFAARDINNHPELLQKWTPREPLNTMDGSSDVTVTLLNYQQSSYDHTLFHSGLVLEIDCLAIDSVLDTNDFISLATIMDTELSGIGHEFRWMALRRPDSLTNFKSVRWEHLRESIGVNGASNKENGEYIFNNGGMHGISRGSEMIMNAPQPFPRRIGNTSAQSVVSLAPARKTVDKIKKKVAAQQDLQSSDYFSASFRTQGTTPVVPSRRKKPYHTGSGGQQKLSNSRSLVSLTKPAPFVTPRQSQYNLQASTDQLTGHPERTGSYSGNSGGRKGVPNKKTRSSNRLGKRSDSVGELVIRNHNEDEEESDVENIEKSIKKMEALLNADIENNDDEALENNEINSAEEDDDDDDEDDNDDEEDDEDNELVDDDMSIGLSAAGLMTKLRKNQYKQRSAGNVSRRPSDQSSSVEIETEKIIDVSLNKEPSESYGITIVDGMQTELKSEGIFVYKLTRNSVAAISKSLQPGDKILAINGYNANNLSFDECMLLITKSVNHVKLTIEKCSLEVTMKMMSVYK